MKSLLSFLPLFRAANPFLIHLTDNIYIMPANIVLSISKNDIYKSISRMSNNSRGKINE
jgi:hypothetical protein